MTSLPPPPDDIARPPDPAADATTDVPPEALEQAIDAEVSDIEIASDVDLGLDDESAAETAAPAMVLRGAGVIRSYWDHAPEGPGVYRMIGVDGAVLYVGKARSIRKRIASYTRPNDQPARIARMIAATASMVFVSTQTETEALLLEANFIKQMKPRFNVLLRDDKSFPYILLTGDHPAPQIAKHRGARNRKGDYFGPFANAGAVNRTINALERGFLLRSCSDSYYENRTRPCLLHQIKRCSAPCTGEISLADYDGLVEAARGFLSGRSRAMRAQFAAEMAEASEALEFERAGRLRDRIAALSAIQGTQGINPRGVEEADVFAVVEQAGQFCVEVFFFRTGQNWGNRAYFPRADKTFGEAEVLDAFLAQFYDDRPAPRLILLSHAVENAVILGEALATRAGRRVEIAAPSRGEKKELVDHAAQNGREELGRRLADTASQTRLLGALGAAFGVAGVVRRVEIYDNSHIMGTNAIGAMVVAGPSGFVKTSYRTFNMKSEQLTPGDDYAMMREMLTRRFARLLKEETGAPAEPDAFPTRPDLILIDGGRGQFEAAKSALATLGIEGVALASIAKGPDRNAGRETFFIDGREPFRLQPRDPALYFVQRLRDEAHRFAIGTHRARRSKDFVKSPLDEIVGIGPARKRALLQAFGTAKAVARAGLADLEKTAGVNAVTARLVYDFFHDRAGN